MFYREDPKPDYMMGQELDLEKEKLSVFWEPAREADLSNPIREKYPFTICCELCAPAPTLSGTTSII